MKKTIVILLALSLVGMMFMSCSNEMGPKQETDRRANVSVSVALEKELATDGASLNALDVNKLYWYYSAEKTSGPFVYGKTDCIPVKTASNAAAQGLSGSKLGEFSLGGWKFVFKGFLEAIDTTKFATAKAVYTTEATFVLEDDLNLTLYLEEGEGMPGNGIQISEGLKYYAKDLADPSKAKLYIYEGSTLLAGPITPQSSGALDDNGYITFTSETAINLPVGTHDLTVKVTVPEGTTEVEIGSADLHIEVGKGVTQMISGTISADDAQSNITVSGYAVKYTLTYNVNGGVALTANTQEVTNGSAYGELPTPTREGYAFSGWFTAATGGTEITATTTVNIKENQTIYAHWAANRTVTLNAHDGECSVESIMVADGMAYGTLPTPTKAGYTFTGWYTAETEGTAVTSTTVCTTAGDHTLHAIWTANTIYVQLNPNHDNLIPTQFTFTYGQTYGTGHVDGIEVAGLPALERSGYNFLGWFTAAENGTEVTNNSFSIEPDDHFLYAHWEEAAAKVTVSFDVGEGSSFEDSRQYVVGEAYGSFPDAYFVDGYLLDGWYTASEGGTKVTTDTVCGNTAHTLYAHWQRDPEYVLVTLDANGGDLGGSSNSMFVRIGYPYPNLPDVYKDDEESGWYTEQTGGTLIIENETVCEHGADHTLYAHWLQKVTVSFDADLGFVDEPTMEVTVGEKYGELPVPEPLQGGYAFRGWYTDYSGAGEKVTANTVCQNEDDHTLHAYWEELVRVNLNANGGKVDPEFVYIEDTYGNLPTPTRDGFIFLGWFTDSDSGDQVTSGTECILPSNHYIYAHWQADPGAGD